MDVFLLIAALGLVTFFTRSIGHLIVSQFGDLHPRVLAALDAVPAAVLVTIVIPPVLNGGLPERLAFIIALISAFRLPPIATVAVGLLALTLLRQFL